MATTTLTILSERLPGITTCTGNSTTVAVDAAVGEFYRLPAGFGDMWVEMIEAQITALSGAFVAPAPLGGVAFHIVSSDALTNQDMLGADEFRDVSTGSARPILQVTIQQFRRTVLRQAELVAIDAPVIAGAGVTASVRCTIRGYRARL